MGCNLSKEQINEGHVCKSKGGLTANVKLHFLMYTENYVNNYSPYLNGGLGQVVDSENYFFKVCYFYNSCKAHCNSI